MKAFEDHDCLLHDKGPLVVGQFGDSGKKVVQENRVPQSWCDNVMTGSRRSRQTFVSSHWRALPVAQAISNSENDIFSADDCTMDLAQLTNFPEDLGHRSVIC
jgi:hypothetical protein